MYYTQLTQYKMNVFNAHLMTYEKTIESYHKIET